MSKGMLSDIAEINPTDPLPRLSSSTLVAFLGMADLSEGGRVISWDMRALGAVAAGFTRFRSNDVLFAKITPCMENGKGGLVPTLPHGIGFGSTEFHVLRAKGENSPEFIYQHSLHSALRQRAAMNMTGSAGQQRVPTSFFSTYPIEIFEPNTQKVIAAILGNVDSLIAHSESLISKYQSIKQGMMHDLFTRGVDENGELRPPYEEAPDLYKKTELGWVPKEWTVELLDHVARRGSGHTPSKSFPAYWNGGVKWVSLADSDKLDNLYIYDTDKNISELGLQNSSAVRHPTGTVILSRDAGIGKSAILASTMAVSQHFMAWVCGSLLDNYFLYYWLQHNKRKFEAIALGSTILTIGLSYFKKLRIAVPQIGEQRKVASVLLGIEKSISDYKGELAKLQMLKQGLMRDLLSGKVRVPLTQQNQKAA